MLDYTELKLNWDAADAEGGPARALVKLLILSGARGNEVTELAREEIGTDAIELPADHTKNGMPHTIPITTDDPQGVGLVGVLANSCSTARIVFWRS